MADKDPDQRKAAAKGIGSYSVSSANKGRGKTVSFSVPTFPRPDTSKLKSLKKPDLRYGLLALGFLLAMVFSGFVGAWIENSSSSPLSNNSLSNQKKVVTSQSQLINQIAKTVGPSVVSVNVNITSTSANPYDYFGFSSPDTQSAAAGTGIIISKDGLIVTNRHVVPSGTTNVSVTLSDGTELKDVSIVGRTNQSDSLDVAFLKINDSQGHKLSPAALGNSSQVQVGDSVVAIGNALGQFQNTLTSGIISGYGRSVEAGDGSGAGSAESLDGLFQTDAAINEGNSGGPLVNMNGQVIGINTAVASGDAQNIGFAIPINNVSGLIDQVVKTGKFARPYLGVRYIMLTSDIANDYNLKVENGAYIAPSDDPANPSVLPDTPAAKAGLKEKDIITAVDDTDVNESHSLTSLLSQHQPGDKVKLTIQRGSDTKQITVTLGSMPESSPSQ
jgi:S1-C subfamily serine protease